MSEAAAEYEFDAVPYPTPIVPHMMPDRIRAAGMMHGFTGPDALTASVLEIGGGTCANSLGIAAASPSAHTVGFDLSRVAVEEGDNVRRLAGLANAQISHGDIMTWPRDGEKFDYILVHGVYSWVPAAVREGILELVAARLAPGGIVYMGFEALPVSAAKFAIKQLIRARVADIPDPLKQIEYTYAMLAVLERNQGKNSPLKQLLTKTVENLANHKPNYFFHDWMAPHYEPLHIRTLVDAAARHGLTYAGDIRMTDLYIDDLDEAGRMLVRSAGPGIADVNIVLDLLRGSGTYRIDMLVRSDAPPPREHDEMAKLSFCFRGTRAPEPGDEPGRIRFSVGTTWFIPSAPADIAVLEYLYRHTGAELSVNAIAAATGLTTELTWETVRSLAVRGLVDSHTTPQPYVLTPGERPLASPLLRAMLSRGDQGASLRNFPFTPDHPATEAVLMHCDGSRTRAEIAAALAPQFADIMSVEKVAHGIAAFAAKGLFAA